MDIEQIFPSIYLTLTENYWTPDQIRAHHFTHIIRIDKHIRNENNNNIPNDLIPEPQAADRVEINCVASHHPQMLRSSKHDGFEILDLNFGESSYLTTVLPNCYKAVTFIDKALKKNGSVLIIDHDNNEKCVTVVVGFLMYKKNLKFR